jgi:hypothetical protein
MSADDITGINNGVRANVSAGTNPGFEVARLVPSWGDAEEDEFVNDSRFA